MNHDTWDNCAVGKEAVVRSLIILSEGNWIVLPDPSFEAVLSLYNLLGSVSNNP
ncbi:MAG: hypothetical protein F6K31_13680 [Symploca sp. SIO2G7]|nr:hypothetical protein [Symploca sp. SIO2G7]